MSNPANPFQQAICLLRMMAKNMSFIRMGNIFPSTQRLLASGMPTQTGTACLRVGTNHKADHSM